MHVSWVEAWQHVWAVCQGQHNITGHMKRPVPEHVHAACHHSSCGALCNTTLYMFARLLAVPSCKARGPKPKPKPAQNTSNKNDPPNVTPLSSKSENLCQLGIPEDALWVGRCHRRPEGGDLAGKHALRILIDRAQTRAVGGALPASAWAHVCPLCPARYSTSMARVCYYLRSPCSARKYNGLLKFFSQQAPWLPGLRAHVCPCDAHGLHSCETQLANRCAKRRIAHAGQSRVIGRAPFYRHWASRLSVWRCMYGSSKGFSFCY